MKEKSESAQLRPRPPVVVVMGHVDHGKTSLLDYIRKANVAAKEAGGITQAVAAYEIVHRSGELQINADNQRISADKNQRKSASDFSAPARKITFIDTPGHEAFSKMRSRGAEVADLAILVVAADESVKPQTKEAVKTLNDAKTSFVVAITKIDKPGADINRVKNDLTAAGVLLEGYGGQVSFHGVSSKTGEGVNDLLDLIVLSADVENLTFDPAAPASGFVLEAKRDSRRGLEVAVIVKNGVLKRGSEIYTPSAKGKVKILENFMGKVAESLEPSAPALIVGFESLPRVGEVFSNAPSSQSQEPSPSFVAKKATKVVSGESKINKDTLNLILKASDAGSLEVLSSIIGAMGTEDKPLHIINESVGDITDGDVKSAIATEAIIIGFKNKVDKGAKNLAEPHEVKIITSDIVYDLVKAAQDFLAELGKPKTIGELEVLAIFNQKRLNEQLVGGKITSGVFRTKMPFEIERADTKAGFGKVLSIREKKADLTQAEAGKEIGLVVNSQTAIAVGDKIVIKK
ncbi:MAG: GTP-binding protein [Candidatus Liptonbacteria bacterium]|nr:GTP-binding protein [Candidatus Liptonbacteria bacterium]